MLVASASALARSLAILAAVDMGFTPERLLVLQTAVPVRGSVDAPRAVAMCRDLMPEVRALPGVTSAAAVMAPPTIIRSNGGYRIEGDDAFVRQSFSGESPIGRRVRCGLDRPDFMTIVGVVGDVRTAGPATPAQAEIYMPFEQHPNYATALALAGVYGVMAYSVSHRVPELGVRIALGATPGDIRRLVFGHGAKLATAGLAIGLGLAPLGTRAAGVPVGRHSEKPGDFSRCHNWHQRDDAGGLLHSCTPRGARGPDGGPPRRVTPVDAIIDVAEEASMRSIGRGMLCAAAVVSFVARMSAADGVLIVQKVTPAGGAPKTNEIQIEQHRMRAGITGPNGASQSMIFDGIHEVMMMIDDDHKTYSEITKADVDAMSQQMSAAMAQIQNATKGMTPEQRAQMEAMMKKAGAAGRGVAGAATPAKTVYHKTGSDTVGKWTCDKYEGTRDGQKVQELCTVDPKVFGFTMTDFSVSKDMAAFFQKMIPPGMGQSMPSAAEMFHIGTPEEQGFSGVPVRTITYSGGQVVSTHEVTDVHRQAFPDSTFQAPAGYTKQASPFAGAGRRGR